MSESADRVWGWIKTFFFVIGIIGGIAYFWNIVLEPIISPLFK